MIIQIGDVNAMNITNSLRNIVNMTAAQCETVAKAIAAYRMNVTVTRFSEFEKEVVLLDKQIVRAINTYWDNRMLLECLDNKKINVLSDQPINEHVKNIAENVDAEIIKRYKHTLIEEFFIDENEFIEYLVRRVFFYFEKRYVSYNMEMHKDKNPIHLLTGLNMVSDTPPPQPASSNAPAPTTTPNGL